MGIRGEIFSNKVILPNRTYFFNVKENRMGDLYLNIVESKNRDSGGFDRQSVILFADDLQEFLKGFDESLRVMEKSMREKRQSGKEGVKRVREKSSDNGERSERGDRSERSNRSERGDRNDRSERGERSDRSNRSERSNRGERSERSNRGERSDRNDRSESGERRSIRKTDRDGGFKKREGEKSRQSNRGGRERGDRNRGDRNRGDSYRSTDRNREQKPGKKFVVKKKDI